MGALTKLYDLTTLWPGIGGTCSFPNLRHLLADKTLQEYWLSDIGVRKEIYRNSITEIEKQLLKIPFITRSHRAFIVNIKRILSKKGNSLGYRLKLTVVAGKKLERSPTDREEIGTMPLSI
jgi:hypothetical protein